MKNRVHEAIYWIIEYCYSLKWIWKIQFLREERGKIEHKGKQIGLTRQFGYFYFLVQVAHFVSVLQFMPTVYLICCTEFCECGQIQTRPHEEETGDGGTRPDQSGVLRLQLLSAFLYWPWGTVCAVSQLWFMLTNFLSLSIFLGCESPFELLMKYLKEHILYYTYLG